MFNIKVLKEFSDYSNDKTIVSRMSQLVNVELTRRGYPYLTYHSRDKLHITEIKTEINLKNTDMFTNAFDQIEYGVEENKLFKHIDTDDVLEKNVKINPHMIEPNLKNLQSEQEKLKEINQNKIEEITPIIKQAFIHTIKNINKTGSIIMNPNIM